MIGVSCSICIGWVSQWCGNHSEENPASRAARTCATISGIRSATLKPSGNCVLTNRPTFMTALLHSLGAASAIPTRLAKTTRAGVNIAARRSRTMTEKDYSVRAILAGKAPPDAPVTVKGWVRTRRDSKAGISFVHLSDGSAFHPLQVVAPSTLPNYTGEVLHLTD